MKLINQSVLNERRDKSHTAISDDILTDLSFQVGDFIHKIALGQNGIDPFRPGQRSGKNNFVCL